MAHGERPQNLRRELGRRAPRKFAASVSRQKYAAKKSGAPGRHGRR